MTFFVVDIGNTRLKWAQYERADSRARLLAHGAVFLEALDAVADTDWAALPQPEGMLGSVVAGDGVRRRVEEQLELWDVPVRWIVSQPRAGGLVNGYDHPQRLGSDRWAALIGAHERMLRGGAPRPTLVVMVGTAVTVDAIDPSGRFLGGLILPGFGLMQRALEMGTAGLHVPTGEVHEFPTNTSDALMSGGSFAIAGAIERMHRHLVTRCGMAPALYMMGGAAVRVLPITPLPFELVDTLIFEGLLRLAAENGSAAGT